MLEVAPPVAIGLWDKPWAWSANHGSGGCMVEPPPYQGGPYINLQSFWNSIAPRTRDVPASRSSTRPSFLLSVQPAVTKPRKRRRSAPRSQDSRRTALTPEIQPQQVPHHPHDTASPQSQKTVEQPAASLETVLGSNTTTAPVDILFSSLAPESGQPYDSKNLCDLCRQPFEADEDALYKHLSQHLRELGGSLSCNKCQILFSHEGDLQWHFRSVEHRDGTDASRVGFCVRLRKWEQAQLRLHSQTIDTLLQSRSNQAPSRSSSVPPRKRKPLDAAIPDAESIVRCHGKSLNPAADDVLKLVTDDERNPVTDDGQTDAIDNPPSRAAMDTELDKVEIRTPQDDSTNGGQASREQATLYSLQRRIRDLMEQFQPNTPNEQATPYAEFCDSHSLPGTPEQLSKDGSDAKVDRALSEPPLRTSRAGDGTKQVAPYDRSSNGHSTSGGAWSSVSPCQGQKRGSDGRDCGQWEEEDGSGNGGLQPKKRKTANGNSTDMEKRFPCIYHIGDPVRFKTDVARHRHISNMCRHLKSHNFYSCSTCITRMPNNDELERHIGQHVKACTRRGCKRTKPAGHYVDPMNCIHIMSAEDQWRELFVLQFHREPPNVFGVGSRAQSHVIDSVELPREADVITDLPVQYSSDSRNDSLVDYGLTDSFFEQAMEFDLGLPPNNMQPDNAPLDIDEFLAQEPAQDLHDPNQTGAGAEAAEAVETPVISENEQPSAPMQDVVASLQQQVTALENMISTQTSKDKDRLFALQEKVVQLEQKLFQSSERERQLEATLEVIFDAFQASGAPQAQPNKPLWNLVKSHSSQVIGSVTSNSGQNGGSQGMVSSNSFLSMSPSLTFASETKVSARTPPDSAYGSVR